MARNLDRVQMTITSIASSGLGTVTLGSAVTDTVNGDWLTYEEAGAINGYDVNYVIWEGNNFEIGFGTYDNTAKTITRNARLSKSGGTKGTSAVAFTSAAKIACPPAWSAGYFDIQDNRFRVQNGNQYSLWFGDSGGSFKGFALPGNYAYGLGGGYNSAGTNDVGLGRSATGTAQINTGLEGGALRKLIVGGFGNAYVSKTAAYTATTYDGLIACDATSAAFTITLPTAVGMSGQEYVIKKVDSSGNAITIATTSSQTIDGATTKSLPAQWDKIKVVSNGANWLIV